MDPGYRDSGFAPCASFSHRVPVKEWFAFRQEDARTVTSDHITWLVMIDCRARPHTSHVFTNDVECGFVTGFQSTVVFKEPA